MHISHTFAPGPFAGPQQIQSSLDPVVTSLGEPAELTNRNHAAVGWDTGPNDSVWMRILMPGRLKRFDPMHGHPFPHLHKTHRNTAPKHPGETRSMGMVIPQRFCGYWAFCGYWPMAQWLAQLTKLLSRCASVQIKSVTHQEMERLAARYLVFSLAVVWIHL